MRRRLLICSYLLGLDTIFFTVCNEGVTLIYTDLRNNYCVEGHYRVA